MRDLAKANATAEINVKCPSRSTSTVTSCWSLLGARRRAAQAAARRPGRCCFKRLRLCLGDALGAVATVVMDGSSNGWAGCSATAPGYGPTGTAALARGSPDVGLHEGTAEREQLEKHLPAPGSWSPFKSRARDRRWASPISAPPTEAGTTSRTQRKALPARDSCATSISRPSAPRPTRNCSRRTRARSAVELLTRPDGDDGRPEMEPVQFLNLLAASWIQFMTHDWVSHGEIEPNDFIGCRCPATIRHAVATSRANGDRQDPD